MKADIVLDVPDGWQEIATAPDEPRCWSPGDSNAVLQISTPSWGSRLRGMGIDEVRPLLAEIVEGGGLGVAEHVATIDLPYGRAFVAEIASDDHEDAAAWLIVPTAPHDVLLVTWLEGAVAYGETAREIVATIRPGMFSTVAAMTVNVNGKQVAGAASHAILVGNGEILQIQLESLPHPMWTDACRHERARTDAEVVAQVLAASNSKTKEPVLSVYIESATRQRELVITADGAWFEIEQTSRRDFFVPADPEIAKVLTTAAR